MQLKHVLLAALCVSLSYSAAISLCAAAADGKVFKYGVCQYCNVNCKTCTTPMVDGCATCHVAGESVTAGKCFCTTGHYYTADVNVIACAATTEAANKCPTGKGFAFDNSLAAGKKCARLANICIKHKADGDKTKCLDGAANCWGGLSPNTGACGYVDAKTFVAGHTAGIWNKANDTVDGYFLNTTSKEWEPLPAGCKTGTNVTTCSACAGTGFTVATDATKGCECKAGSWVDTASKVCAVNTVANCDVQATTDTCTTCKATFTIDATKKICAAATTATATATTATTTGAIVADTPPTGSGCEATNYGCTVCDSATKGCTTCNDAKSWMLDGTKCKCKADYVGSTTDNKDCGLKCATSCVSP